MALILNIHSALLLGILYLFFGAFAIVFEGAYGFNLWQTGLTFLGMLVGMFAGTLTSGLWMKVRGRLIAKNGGKIEPEFRLPSVMVGSIFVTIGMFWFAWTTMPSVHWIVPIIGSGVFGLGVSAAAFSLHNTPLSSGTRSSETGLYAICSPRVSQSSLALAGGNDVSELVKFRGDTIPHMALEHMPCVYILRPVLRCSSMSRGEPAGDWQLGPHRLAIAANFHRRTIPSQDDPSTPLGHYLSNGFVTAESIWKAVFLCIQASPVLSMISHFAS